MNRRWQLEHTLPHNLDVLRGTRHFLALCNYNSRDGLDAYVRDRFREPCGRRTLVYFHTKAPAFFHASRAKNTAHRLAAAHGATVLFNLDADNYITRQGLGRLARMFGRRRKISVHEYNWSDPRPGSFGRIGLSVRSWLALGGYDETFDPMAFQDVDLLLRARALGMSYRALDGPAIAPVENSWIDKMRHVGLAIVTDRVAAGCHQMFDRANYSRALYRPIALPMSAQRRYRGVLNFETSVCI
jgi:hypothetical protein